MEAMGAMLNTPEEVQWDKDNGAVYKVYSMAEMTGQYLIMKHITIILAFVMALLIGFPQ